MTDPARPDFAGGYQRAQERVISLVESASEEALAAIVPACPVWTVRDLFAHLAGLAQDVTGGKLEGVGQPDWTQAQVEERHGAAVSDIAAEWRSLTDRLHAALSELHPALAASLFADVVTHEHDLRGALGAPGERESAEVRTALDSYVRLQGRKVDAAALAALDLISPDALRRMGKSEPPAGSVSGSTFDLFRSVSGRRTPDEIRALEWTTDPEPYLPVISVFGFPDAPLGE